MLSGRMPQEAVHHLTEFVDVARYVYYGHRAKLSRFHIQIVVFEGSDEHERGDSGPSLQPAEGWELCRT